MQGGCVPYRGSGTAFAIKTHSMDERRLEDVLASGTQPQLLRSWYAIGVSR